MLIALGVFSVVMLIILGAYFLLVVRDERKLLDRLAAANPNKRAGKLGVVKAEDKLSSVDAFDKVLRGSKYTSPVRVFVEQSGKRFLNVVFGGGQKRQ